MIAQPRTIIQVSLKSLHQECVLDITPYATPQRYRLIHCDRFVQDATLSIEEFTDFPSVQYAAISYVWKGNPLEPPETKSDLYPTMDAVDGNRHHKFSVAGALDGDPISIHVLNQACLTAIKHGARYIWLDRLCIMQTNREDKNWQIKQMSEMYKRCNPCIVLPGGVQKLVRIDEETAWIHRGWTLQELLLPERAVVLLAWKLGAGSMKAGDESGTVSEVTPNESAVISAADALNACVASCIEFTSPHCPSSILIRSCIFGTASPNLYATSVAMSKILAPDPDARHHAIWQSALMRTSSRPVDMVFSIMGLFGVNLDPGEFGKEDRIYATAALAKEILRQGGRASWLGMSFRLPPCSMLCTFPIFAETNVSGNALVRTRVGLQEVSKFVDGEYPNAEVLGALPKGTMDDDGYFTFSARAVRVVRVITEQDKDETVNSSRKLVKSINGRVWEIIGEENAQGSTSLGSTYGVILGWFQEYHPGLTLSHNQNYIKGMIVEEHTPERFHIATFFSLHLRDKEWVESWGKRPFSVGGPKALTHESHPAEETFDDTEACYFPEPRGTSRRSEREIVAAMSKSAKPQVEAEYYLRGYTCSATETFFRYVYKR